jgi:hypothetical protein
MVRASPINAKHVDGGCAAAFHVLLPSVFQPISWSCAASDVPSATDIAELRSSDPAQRQCGLLRLLHAAKRGRADPNCAGSWVAAGAVRAITAGITAAPVDVAAQQVTAHLNARRNWHRLCLVFN